MFLKILLFASVVLLCEGTIPDRLYFRRTPLRFWLNNQGGMRRPGANWSYQVVNGRPVISGFPNPHAYVAFGLNPQTGQVEQTQIITQTRPGGPVVNMIQNMLHVAGQFFGQLTGAFGNAVGGALHTAGQFGQDIQDLTNPVISVTGVSQPVGDKEPIQQPSTGGSVRPPVVPSTPAPAAPTISAPVPTAQTLETVPEEAKSDIPIAARVIDQALIAFQTFRTNVKSTFQAYFESEEGEVALSKINENIDWVVNKLQTLRDSMALESSNVLQSGQNAVNTAFDNVEIALVGVAGTAGRDFIEPTRNEINESFSNAIQALGQSNISSSTVTEIIPSK